MLATTLLSLALLQSLSGPDPDRFQPGDRARVYAPSLTGNRYHPFDGTVQRVDSAEIVIIARDGLETRIPLAAVVEWRRVPVHSAGQNALRLLGAAVGAGASQLQPTSIRALGVAAGGLIGVFGGSLHRERWLPIRPARPEPRAGMVVRIQSPRFMSEAPVPGTIRSWGRDSVEFTFEGRTEVVTLATSEVSIEWPVHRARQTALGAGIGMLVGGLIGAGLAHSAETECASSSGFSFCGLSALGSVAGGVTVGLLVGGLLGHSAVTTTWEGGNPSHLAVALVPVVSPRGAGAAVSIRF